MIQTVQLQPSQLQAHQLFQVGVTTFLHTDRVRHSPFTGQPYSLYLAYTMNLAPLKDASTFALQKNY